MQRLRHLLRQSLYTFSSSSVRSSSHLVSVLGPQSYFSTSRTHCWEQNEPKELLPMSFSSALKQKMSPNRLNRFQKIYNDTQSQFFLDVSEVQNISELLELVEKHADTFDLIEVVAANDIIFAFMKDEKSENRRKELANSVGMQKFLKMLRRKSRSMEGKELISGVKLLNFIGVSGSDTNLLLLLKMLTKLANTLEPSDIIYLSFILKKFPDDAKSPICAALQLALPVVFESNLTTLSQNGSIDQESIQSICDYLYFGTANNISDKLVQSLITSIERQLGAITPRQAMSIIWSLGDARHNDPYQEKVLSECFKIVVDNIESYELNVLSTTLKKACTKYLKNVHFFYNEDFVQALCNRLMSRYNNKNDQTLYSFKSISLLRHVHVEYMDRVGELIAARPSDILNNDYLFLILIRSFSGCNYKPEKWSKFEAMLLNHPALIKDLGPQEISLAVDFLALETFPEILIQKIFSPEGLPALDAFVERNSFFSSHTLLLLFNAIQFLYPQYSGPLPPSSMINKWKQLVKQDRSKRVYPLKGALQSGFGGENYVINGIYCCGHHFDHAVVMRKGGYPIAVNNLSSINDLDDIQKPPESEVLLVKVFWKEAYSNNTPRLRGVMALEQRIIEKMGHPFVALDGQRWSELQDHEKIPFLMQRIREKTDRIQWNQSGSDVIPR